MTDESRKNDEQTYIRISINHVERNYDVIKQLLLNKNFDEILKLDLDYSLGSLWLLHFNEQGIISQRAEEVLKIIGLTFEEPKTVRWQLGHDFMEFGTISVPELVANLSASNIYTRRNAACLLKYVCGKDLPSESIDPLIRLLYHPTYVGFWQAVCALNDCSDERARIFANIMWWPGGSTLPEQLGFQRVREILQEFVVVVEKGGDPVHTDAAMKKCAELMEKYLERFIQSNEIYKMLNQPQFEDVKDLFVAVCIRDSIFILATAPKDLSKILRDMVVLAKERGANETAIADLKVKCQRFYLKFIQTKNKGKGIVEVGDSLPLPKPLRRGVFRAETHLRQLQLG